MTVAQKTGKWAVNEFFAWHELQEERYELVAGFPVLKHPPVPVTLPGAMAPTMMTGACRQQNKIKSNLTRLIGNQLRNGHDVYASTVAVRTGYDQIRYPDLVVDHDTNLDGAYVFENPTLVAEILSCSIRPLDFVGRLTEFWRIETLIYVLVVDPAEQRAQLHVRHPGDSPTLHVYQDADDTIELPDLGVTLQLADIFAGLPTAAAP